MAFHLAEAPPEKVDDGVEFANPEPASPARDERTLRNRGLTGWCCGLSASRERPPHEPGREGPKRHAPADHAPDDREMEQTIEVSDQAGGGWKIEGCSPVG
jgi:hypothetical protein